MRGAGLCGERCNVPRWGVVIEATKKFVEDKKYKRV
jgi:hypothetical protein